MFGRGIDQQLRRSQRILRFSAFQQVRNGAIAWFDFTIPLLHSRFLPREVFIAMAFLAGVFDSHLLIECWTRNRYAVIGARVGKPLTDSVLLQVRHVARGAEIPR